MGDRFYLKLKCAYCSLESDVYYAPTCGMYDFTCQEKESFHEGDKSSSFVKSGCGKINFICADLATVKKSEDIVEDDVIQAFEMATTASHSIEAIKKEAKFYLRNLKRQVKKLEGNKNGR